MFLIEGEPKGKKSSLKVEIDSQTKSELRLYCRCTHATPEQVIRGALQYLFKSDTQFQQWKETEKQKPPIRRQSKKKSEANGTAMPQPIPSAAEANRTPFASAIPNPIAPKSIPAKPFERKTV